uniref:WD repeat-containing protein 47 n=1 Tax=Parascaris univalens TaxID=6257 RepID=A0A915C590_PARUN
MTVNFEITRRVFKVGKVLAAFRRIVCNRNEHLLDGRCERSVSWYMKAFCMVIIWRFFVTVFGLMIGIEKRSSWHLIRLILAPFPHVYEIFTLLDRLSLFSSKVHCGWLHIVKAM